MKQLLIILFLVFVQSCENEKTKVPENKISDKEENTIKVEHAKEVDEVQKTIVLGEDVQEINSYVTNIYEKESVIYVDLDFVEITYKNVDERVIINKNSKIRTYIVDRNTNILARV